MTQICQLSCFTMPCNVFACRSANMYRNCIYVWLFAAEGVYFLLVKILADAAALDMHVHKRDCVSLFVWCLKFFVCVCVCFQVEERGGSLQQENETKETGRK